ncbi:glycosyltransferase [candidate division WWE3 bacterium]|nr:glycosyltransferase [candidate division WWE3 bacterium]
MNKRITIGIPTYNGKNQLKELLDSIQTSYGDDLNSIETIVSDDGSIDGTIEMVETHYPWVILEKVDQNKGIAHATKLILECMSGDYLLRLDADTIVNREAIEYLIKFLETHPQAGVVAPRLIDKNDRFQPSYETHLKHPLEWFWDYALWLKKIVSKQKRLLDATHQPFIVSYLASAAILIRKEAIDRVGGLDPEMEFFMEDADWIIRIGKAGYEIWYAPQVSIIHIGGQSGLLYIHTRDRSLKNLYYFYAKHVPGWLTQFELFLAIISGSTISLVMAILAYPILIWKQNTRVIDLRAIKSFLNVWQWHISRIGSRKIQGVIQ